MTNPLDIDRINAELVMVGEMMRECLDDFVNLRTTREEFDEMMSSYADRIDTARHQHDKLVFSDLGEIMMNFQEHIEPVPAPKTKKKK